MIPPYQIVGGAASALALGSWALYGTFVPTSSFWGKVIWRAGEVSQPWIALTFDDGPTDGCTNKVLDLLAKTDVRAAFFVIGRNAKLCPELVRRMDNEGHLVAGHSYDHGHFDLFRGWRYWLDQMKKTNNVIAEAIGKRPAIFRPPMGFKTHPIHYSARRTGQRVVTWSRRAFDGRGGRDGNILGKTKEALPGDILMLHDGVDPNLRRRNDRDRKATIAALPALIAGLHDRGLAAVRLDQLLGVAGYVDAPAASAARVIQ